MTLIDVVQGKMSAAINTVSNSIHTRKYSLRAWNVIAFPKQSTTAEEVEALLRLWQRTTEEAHELFLGQILEE